MSVRRIVDALETWRAARAPLALVTVYETLGSTYSKAGHRILVAANGDYQGLVSGGCLEGDLAERARRVIDARSAAAVTYDLRDEADELWGLGIGCNGLIRVLIQPLADAEDYEPFASIATCWLADAPAGVALVVASGSESTPAGGTLIHAADAERRWRVGAEHADALVEGCRRAVERGGAELVSEASGLDVLYSPLVPVPRVLILGAGPDAVPLVTLVTELGWRVTVADHRAAYVARDGFSAAEHVVHVDPDRLSAQVALERFDAIIVMSHHLATDRVYLEQIASSGARYVGVLGPAARKARLLDELGADAAVLAERLRGPVGIDIGADTPESIALSVAAELQQIFSTRRAPRG